ncbi:hypothetical protein HDU81_000525 [Chytriomyces hyalinus]|nr:hypothetical protein HDU81_000525 [Chytriomyces hyalinus]
MSLGSISSSTADFNSHFRGGSDALRHDRFNQNTAPGFDLDPLALQDFGTLTLLSEPPGFTSRQSSLSATEQQHQNDALFHATGSSLSVHQGLSQQSTSAHTNQLNRGVPMFPMDAELTLVNSMNATLSSRGKFNTAPIDFSSGVASLGERNTMDQAFRARSHTHSASFSSSFDQLWGPPELTTPRPSSSLLYQSKADANFMQEQTSSQMSNYKSNPAFGFSGRGSGSGVGGLARGHSETQHTGGRMRSVSSRTDLRVTAQEYVPASASLNFGMESFDSNRGNAVSTTEDRLNQRATNQQQAISIQAFHGEGSFGHSRRISGNAHLIRTDQHAFNVGAPSSALLSAEAPEYTPMSASNQISLAGRSHASSFIAQKQQLQLNLPPPLSTASSSAQYNIQTPVTPYEPKLTAFLVGGGVSSVNVTAVSTDTDTHREDVERMILERGLNPDPRKYDLRPANARFFVIKSFREDHVFKAIKYNVWSSTEMGNKRLNQAFKDSSPSPPPIPTDASTNRPPRHRRESTPSAPQASGPVILFFSVNGSGHFCGVAQMTSGVDWNTKSRVFTSGCGSSGSNGAGGGMASSHQQQKWEGVFGVRWVFVKDVANSRLKHLRVL